MWKALYERGERNGSCGEVKRWSGGEVEWRKGGVAERWRGGVVEMAQHDWWRTNSVSMSSTATLSRGMYCREHTAQYTLYIQGVRHLVDKL